MIAGPSPRHLLLRRVTLAVSAVSVALAGLVYIQVSGLAGGVLDASGSAGDAGQTTAGGGGVTLQTPAAGPSTGGGTPVARTGGS